MSTMKSNHSMATDMTCATETSAFEFKLRSTPQPTDTSAPPTPSLSFSNFRLSSSDSMMSLCYDSSPILRDFQELTLSLTDDESSAITPKVRNNGITPLAQAYGRDSDCDSDNDLGNNPFLMGLAINIPNKQCDMSDCDIESCDDECGHVTDFESENSETETIFNMKKYEHISNIGIGAFGIVDKVFDPINNRFIAIKQSRSIGDEILKQFRNEQTILRECSECPYIIDLLDYGKNFDANQICLGLEFMDIGSLCNIRKYSLLQIAYICKCVLKALLHLHSKGYVHNDIKPENILVCTQGRVKLIDFGCTMQLENERDFLTKSVGSIRYLSFEKRFCAPIKYNTKSDIYSFGISICDIYNGTHHKKSNNGNKYNHYFNLNANIDCEISDDAIFNDFVAKTLVKDPTQRYSAQQLLDHSFLRNVPSNVSFTA